MQRKTTIIKSVDKEGREVFTYLRRPGPPPGQKPRRRRLSDAVRVTLKLPKWPSC
jgi:hypothetical protein